MEWKDILSPWNGEYRSALREKNEDQILGVEPINELDPQRALKPSILVFISLWNCVLFAVWETEQQPRQYIIENTKKTQ